MDWQTRTTTELTMNTRQFAVTALFPLLLGIAAAAQARPAAESCVLTQYGASSAAPYRAEENVGYGTYTQLRGAQVFVPAREGLTEQWLTLQVQRNLGDTCKPGVKDVRVQVVSAGTGFWVQLIAANQSNASDLLHWAEGIVRRAGF
jgi:hypothetical protein